MHEELGLVERGWQSIERIAIAALRHAPNNCSFAMWANSMRYGKNSHVQIARERPPCDDLTISNEQRLTGKLPSYSLWLPFYTPVRFFVDPETRSNKWDEKARAGWFVGPSPENSSKPYVWDGYAHITAGAGMQAFPAFAFDTNDKGNKRIHDADWEPNTPVRPPPQTLPPALPDVPPPQRTGQPSNELVPSAPPLARTRTRRRQPLHPFATVNAAEHTVTVTLPSAIAPTRTHAHASIYPH